MFYRDRDWKQGRDQIYNWTRTKDRNQLWSGNRTGDGFGTGFGTGSGTETSTKNGTRTSNMKTSQSKIWEMLKLIGLLSEWPICDVAVGFIGLMCHMLLGLRRGYSDAMTWLQRGYSGATTELRRGLRG